MKMRWSGPSGIEEEGVFRGEEAIRVQRGLDYLGGGLVLDRLDPAFLYSPAGAGIGRAVRRWEANAWAWGAEGTHRASLVGILEGMGGDGATQAELLDRGPPPRSRYNECRQESAADLGAPQMERSMTFAAYHEAGHAIVAALLPTSSVGEGGVTVVVTEGRLGGTEVEHWSDPEEDPMSVVHELAVLLAGMAAEDPTLAQFVQRTQGLLPCEFLRFVDAFNTAQPGLLRDAEEEAEERDRNKFTNADVATSAVEVLAAGV